MSSFHHFLLLYFQMIFNNIILSTSFFIFSSRFIEILFTHLINNSMALKNVQTKGFSDFSLYNHPKEHKAKEQKRNGMIHTKNVSFFSMQRKVLSRYAAVKFVNNTRSILQRENQILTIKFSIMIFNFIHPHNQKVTKCVIISILHFLGIPFQYA